MDERRDTLLIATRSAGKLGELAALLENVPFRCVSLDEAGVTGEVEETGATLEENAAIKAEGYARLSGMLTLADDSGLEVDALGGEPGVRSARYAPGSDRDRIDLLLRNLEGVDPADMGARFRCVIAVAEPGGEPPSQSSPEMGEEVRGADLYEGVCEGVIVREVRGGGGFGYDPVFLVSALGRTMAELAPWEKNRVSHRGIAARKAAAALRDMGGEPPHLNLPPRGGEEGESPHLNLPPRWGKR